MRACDRCGESNHDDARYCGTCGVSMPTSGGLGALVAGDVGSDIDATSKVESNLAGVRSTEHVDAPTFGETGDVSVGEPAPPTVPDATPTAPRHTETAAQPTAAAPLHTASTAPHGRRADDSAATVFVAPARSSRSAGRVIAVLVVAAVVIVGGVFALLASAPDADETARPGGDTTPTPTVAPATDATAPVATETVPTDTLEVETPPVETVALEPIVPVTDPAATAAPESTPAETQPTTPTPTRGPGDLGLAQPILDESCDGRYITFVGSAIGDRPYGSVVDELLDRYPGTNYIWTKACPSLRQEFTTGADIYGVVYGPFPTQDEACNARAFGPEDAYVRRISTTDPQDHTVRC